MRYPHFIFADNMEDKGIEKERAQQFQYTLIERLKSYPTDSYQLIYTTSYITPELDQSDYVVGDHYTMRNRVGLDPLPASVTGSKEALLEAYLNERRLELAFEGQRWYDLVRLDKVEAVMNSVFSKDEGRLPQVYPYNQYSYRLPIPQSEIDANDKLDQNDGY